MAVPFEMLLHPEFLNNEQLICIIQDRQLRIPNIERMSRDELLDLFHNYCVPYGQRKYRDSGRGKVLNRNRHISPEPTKITIINECQSRKLSHTNCERLKPPPDLLTGHIKRIKLDNIAETIYNNTINIIKRKMSNDSMIPAATDSPPPKKGRKPITWP